MSEPNSDRLNTITRRGADRQQCYLEVALADATTGFRAATVLDLSAGGVKLLAEPPPAPGEQLQLTFLTDSGRLFQIPATVIHYQDHGGSFAVGCRFARQLDDQEMQALMV